MEILPYLTTAKRGYTCKGDLCEVIQCILYKLKTGCQWHLIPTMAIFTEVVLHYKTIFGKFRQWCKDGSWQKSWESLLERNRDKIDLSSADLDGSHTVARRGGEEVGGAAHKAAQTTNAISVADCKGIPIAMSDPKSGRHHDVHEIENSLDQIFGMMRNAGIPTDGLFLNADAGFDCHDLRRKCESVGIIANVDFNSHTQNDEKYLLDTELLSLRYSIERTNAWMDSFRSVLNRFDKTASSWKGWNLLAFHVIFLKHINKFKKSR